jgi:hypothetical protein
MTEKIPTTKIVAGMQVVEFANGQSRESTRTIYYRALRGGPSQPLPRNPAHESRATLLRGRDAPPSRVVRFRGALLLHHGDAQRG